MEDLNLHIEDEQRKKALESSKMERAIATTGVFFLLFLAPVAFGIFGFPINLYLGVSVAIHEIGHILFGVLGGGNRLTTVAGGTIFEYLNPLIAIMLFANSKRGATLAMIFLACVGSVLPYTANYMESAGNPHGTSCFGAILGRPNDMSPENHDWAIMLSEWGLIGLEREIGGHLRVIGQVLVLVGVIGSAIGFWFLMNYYPGGFSELLLVGSIPSAIYFALSSSIPQLAVCAGIMFLVVVWFGLKLAWKKLSESMRNWVVH